MIILKCALHQNRFVGTYSTLLLLLLLYDPHTNTLVYVHYSTVCDRGVCGLF